MLGPKSSLWHVRQRYRARHAKHTVRLVRTGASPVAKALKPALDPPVDRRGGPRKQRVSGTYASSKNGTHDPGKRSRQHASHSLENATRDPFGPLILSQTTTHRAKTPITANGHHDQSLGAQLELQGSTCAGNRVPTGAKATAPQARHEPVSRPTAPPQAKQGISAGGV